MHDIIPTSIEAHLRETGFTNTDILVVRRLFETDALTLRDMALKTGKSAGLLDQSVKKLLQRGFVRRFLVNNQPRYAINSLDAFSQAISCDTRKRCAELQRRQQDFHNFLHSVSVCQDRPDMDYFLGIDGIRKLFDLLLAPRDTLYTTTASPSFPDDHPLFELHQEIHRLRQMRKVHQKLLLPDSVESARFQSLDVLHRRESLLLPASSFCAPFEKSVSSSIIACIDWRSLRGCLIRFPDLAVMERMMFEEVWRKITSGSSNA